MKITKKKMDTAINIALTALTPIMAVIMGLVAPELLTDNVNRILWGLTLLISSIHVIDLTDHEIRIAKLENGG